VRGRKAAALCGAIALALTAACGSRVPPRELQAALGRLSPAQPVSSGEALPARRHNLNSASFGTTDADLDGTLAASTTVPYTTSPRLAPYREAMQRYQPGAPLGGYGASAWAHALLMERLTSAWAKERPGSPDVIEALYGLRNETIGGLIVPITFNRGPHGAVNLCVVPLRYESGMFRPPGGGDGTFTCPGYVPGGGRA
jgi:hypothetical protein